MLDDFQAKSTVVSNTLTNIDVFSITSNEKCAFLNYLKVVNGSHYSNPIVGNSEKAG